MSGILPFGAVYIELFFIFSALWENQFYYLFGFLFLVFLILVVSVSLISVVLVYFQICGEASKFLFFLYLHCIYFSLFSLLYLGTSKIRYLLNFFITYRCLNCPLLILQDYHWWWKSFIISGGSAVYILIYSVFYFFTKLEITEFIPTLLYIGYTGDAYLLVYLLVVSLNGDILLQQHFCMLQV